MQLKIQRSQRAGGLASNTVFFCLDVRADYSSDERSNIGRYNLGSQTIYNSRSAQKYLDQSGDHLARTQEGSVGNRLVGLARGAASLALAKMQLNITIASLGRGHHVECKNLEELLETEDTVRTACKSLTRYLQIAESFDGSETVIEFVDGEERVHVTPHAPPLLEYAGTASRASSEGSTAVTTQGGYSDLAPIGDGILRELAAFWDKPGNRKLVFIGVGVLVLFLLLRSCFG